MPAVLRRRPEAEDIDDRRPRRKAGGGLRCPTSNREKRTGAATRRILVTAWSSAGVQSQRSGACRKTMSKNRTSIFHQERRESVTKPTGSQLLIHTLFPPAAPPPLCGRAQPVGYSAQATGFRVLIKSNHPNQLDCKYASKPQRAHAGSLRNGIKIGRGSFLRLRASATSIVPG